MIDEVQPTSKCAHQGLCFTATAARLVVRPTIVSYVAYIGLALAIAAMPWICWIFFIGGDSFPTPIFVVFVPIWGFLLWAFIAFFCRWLIFDRRRDVVRYFPRELCAVAKIRAVRIER